jgi:NAD kinase
MRRKKKKRRRKKKKKNQNNNNNKKKKKKKRRRRRRRNKKKKKKKKKMMMIQHYGENRQLVQTAEVINVQGDDGNGGGVAKRCSVTSTQYLKLPMTKLQEFGRPASKSNCNCTT